jgi:hypothetical protein
LNEEFNAITKALINGKGTDERLHSLEMRIKVLQQKYNSLVNLEPFVKDTPEDASRDNDEQKRKQVLLSLINK